MKPKFIPFLLATLFSILISQAQTPSDELFQTVLNRVHQEQIADVKDVRKLDQFIEVNLLDLDLGNGKYKSIDYTDHKRINPAWLPVLEKIRTMTLAYSHPKSTYYKDPKIWKAIQKSLEYFSSLKPLPYCDNWYQQGVTRPQSLALSLVNMRFGAQPLDDLVEKSTLAAICKDTAVTSNGRNNPMHKFNFGANKSLIAMGWIYIGALLKNEKMLEVGAKQSYAPIQYTTGEGIQYDLSYDMHYGYLYNGGYGTVFMSSVIKSASYTLGTKYTLQGEKLDLFRKFILESIFGVIRAKWIDWNVIGRGISRIGATQIDYTSSLDLLEEIDPQGKEQYQAIKQRMTTEQPASFKILPLHRHYWNSDYTVHVRPSYFISIHAVSNRKYSQEIGNSENMKGFWGAEGTMNLQLKGNEYYNIFPLWNWTRLPGTTLPDTLPVLKDKAPGSGDRRGTDPFSGGVSDSLYGATAYVMRNDLQVSAKKGWFMFDDEIVCLGAGLNSSLAYPIATTLNQAIAEADGLALKSSGRRVYYKNNQDLHLSFNNCIEWVLHDQVGYIFPEKGNVHLSVENRRGDWTDISRTGEKANKKIESKSVFQLSLDHGTKPKGAKYVYILLPGMKTEVQMKDYLKKRNIKIESNTDKLQAVYHQGLQIWQMVFYEGGLQFDDGQVKISTDIPAVLMLRKRSNGQYQLHAADPAPLHDRLKVKIQLRGAEDRMLTLDLPQKQYAGQTVTVLL
jgi:chondroitin AC lyase